VPTAHTEHDVEGDVMLGAEKRPAGHLPHPEDASVCSENVPHGHSWHCTLGFRTRAPLVLLELLALSYSSERNKPSAQGVHVAEAAAAAK
jgi:hypothetical protein